jgi:hypothetical protein
MAREVFYMPRSEIPGSITLETASSRVGQQSRGRGKCVSGMPGFGPGRCGWFHASELAKNSSPDTKVRLLMEQADILERHLDEINKSMLELRKDTRGNQR